MARGVTLIRMLTELRAEARISQQPAHNLNARDPQVVLLQRKQEWLWEDFDWPHLKVDRYIDLEDGQRYYSPPDDLDVSRILEVSVRTDNVYEKLISGIGECEYAAYDSDLDVRSWPARRWLMREDESLTPQIEIWPIPDQNFDAASLQARLKLTGIRKLRPLVEEDDVCDLDHRLIVLHAAAELLAADNAPDAQLKLDMATKLYAKLKSGLIKRRTYAMFDVRRDENRRFPRYPIAVYNKTVP